jgi:hypothetical protein
MSPRDKVLMHAGAVVQAWRRTMSNLPDHMEDAIQALRQSIDDMNSESRSRCLDPETSRQGPESLRMTENRSSVLKTLSLRPLTDIELVQAMSSRMSASGARTRRSELVRMGLVKDSGRRKSGPTGRSHIVWEVV